MRTLVNQCQRIRHRIVGRQYHRGVDNQVAALDEVHRALHRGDRKVLRQHHYPVAAIRRPPTAVMLATTTGMVVPEPSWVARSTSNRDATSERFGTMKTSS